MKKGIVSVKRIVIGIVALLIAAVVVWRVVQASAPSEPSPDVEQIRARSGIPVEVVPVTRAPLEVRRSFTGTVRGIRSATVRAKTGDEIEEIPVRVGDRVETKEVVVRQSTEGSQASVHQAEAAWEQAQRNVDRLRPLHEEGAVSDQDWDNALTALRVAEANLEAARRSVHLTSPIDGVVTDVPATVGSFPAPGDPLLHISDLSRFQVLLEVSPGQREELRLGQRAILLGAGTKAARESSRRGQGEEGDHETGWSGEITRIGMQAQPGSRLFEVEATFPAPPAGASVMPGALTTVAVVVGTRDNALIVPPVALQDGGVWLVDEEDNAHFRQVQTGLRSPNQVEILEGLQEGDRVVVAGASLLSDGVLTRVVGG